MRKASLPDSEYPGSCFQRVMLVWKSRLVCTEVVRDDTSSRYLQRDAVCCIYNSLANFVLYSIEYKMKFPSSLASSLLDQAGCTD